MASFRNLSCLKLFILGSVSREIRLLKDDVTEFKQIFGTQRHDLNRRRDSQSNTDEMYIALQTV